MFQLICQHRKTEPGCPLTGDHWVDQIPARRRLLSTPILQEGRVDAPPLIACRRVSRSEVVPLEKDLLGGALTNILFGPGASVVAPNLQPLECRELLTR